jgi:hypothetical protein
LLPPAQNTSLKATTAPEAAPSARLPLSAALAEETNSPFATDNYPTAEAIDLAATVMDAPGLAPTIASLALDPLYRGLALNLKPKPEVRKTFLRVGFIGGPDYLRVITPPTRIGFDTVVALDRYALGYHGGITMGVERGRWEIESGAIYAARRYAPVPVLYVRGSLREGYRNDTAQLPVQCTAPRPLAHLRHGRPVAQFSAGSQLLHSQRIGLLYLFSSAPSLRRGSPQ